MQKPGEMITSRQNPLVSLTAKLADRKHREREGLFRFDGKKLFLEALRADIPLYAVLLRESAATAILSAVESYCLPADCRLVTLSDGLFDRISEEHSPEGVIVLARPLADLHRTLDVAEWERVAPAKGAARVLSLKACGIPATLAPSFARLRPSVRICWCFRLIVPIFTIQRCCAQPWVRFSGNRLSAHLTLQPSSARMARTDAYLPQHWMKRLSLLALCPSGQAMPMW